MLVTFDRIEGLRFQDGKGGATSRASGSYITIPFWEQFDNSGCGGAVDSFSVSSASRINYLADPDLCRFDELLTDSLKISAGLEMAGENVQSAWELLLAYMDAAKTAAGTSGTSGIHAETLAGFTTAFPKGKLGRDGLIDPKSGTVLRYVELGLGEDRCKQPIQMLNGSISMNFLNDSCGFLGRVDISYMMRYRPAKVTQSLTALAGTLQRTDIATSSAYTAAPTFATARNLIASSVPFEIDIPVAP